MTILGAAAFSASILSASSSNSSAISLRVRRASSSRASLAKALHCLARSRKREASSPMAHEQTPPGRVPDTDLSQVVASLMSVLGRKQT